jgi:GTPase SAR1 family protein
LKELNLTDNRLSTLPESISTLTNLNVLNLNNNRLSTLPESISTLTNLNVLDLENNQLTTLPESISTLTNLNTLNLSYNQLTTLPESISTLTNLKELNLTDNRLSTLPSSISTLTNLNKLYLYHNQVSTLPESISTLTNLNVLDLSSNQLSTLPSSILTLTNLKELNLGFNRLSTLPSSISKLTNLNVLNLWNNRLTTLPSSISTLTNLNTLYLNHNQLSTLPESIVALPLLYIGVDIDKLSLSKQLLHFVTNYKIITLKKLMEQRRTPEEILVRGPEAIRAYNKALKEGKSKPIRLKLMVVGQARVGKTSILRSLTNRELNQNQDSTTLMEIFNVDIGTWSLVDEQNTVEDVNRVSVKYVVEMMKQIETNKQQRDEKISPITIADNWKPIPEADVHGVEYNATKTCHYDTTTEQYQEGSTPKESVSTKEETLAQLNTSEIQNNLGSELEPIPKELMKLIQQGLKNKGDFNDPLIFNTWDFAGQEDYYTVHQLFITSRAIYLIVFNMNQANISIKQNNSEWLESLHFWINSLLAHLKSPSTNENLLPSIFIAGTHYDLVAKDRDCDIKHLNCQISESIRDLFKSKNTSYSAALNMIMKNQGEDLYFFPVDNVLGSKDDKIRYLKKNIDDLVQQQRKDGFLSEEIPIKWFQFQQELISLRNESEHNTNNRVLSATQNSCVDYAFVERLAKKHHNIDGDELDIVLQFFHDIGSIVYYNDTKLHSNDNNNNTKQEPSATYQNLIVIDPKWLVGLIRQVLRRGMLPHDQRLGNLTNVEEETLNEGTVTKKTLEKIWRSFNVDVDFVIHLMNKFSILCTYDDKEFFIPCLRKQILADWDHNNRTNLTCFFTFRTYLPKALFHFVVAQCLSLEKDGGFEPEVTGNSCVCLINNQRTFLQLLLPQRQLKVIVEPNEGEIPYKVIEVLKEIMANLNELWMKGIQYDEFVSCPKCCLATSEVHNHGLVPLQSKAKISFCTAKPQCKLNKEQDIIQNSWLLPFKEQVSLITLMLLAFC